MKYKTDCKNDTQKVVEGTELEKYIGIEFRSCW